MGQVGLVVFVKNPELGKVKTRIAATAGDAEALRIYKELLKHTNEVATQVPCQRYVYYADYINDDDLWKPSLFEKRVQQPGSLGHRMAAASQEVLAHCQKVVIIGSDCASLAPEHLVQAYQTLDQADVVIGPTYDGGYYLIGMNSYHASLFANIKWSSELVYQQTITAAELSGLTVASLAVLSDIDHESDWQKYGW